MSIIHLDRFLSLLCDYIDQAYPRCPIAENSTIADYFLVRAEIGLATTDIKNYRERTRFDGPND